MTVTQADHCQTSVTSRLVSVRAGTRWRAGGATGSENEKEERTKKNTSDEIFDENGNMI